MQDVSRAAERKQKALFDLVPPYSYLIDKQVVDPLSVEGRSADSSATTRKQWQLPTTGAMARVILASLSRATPPHRALSLLLAHFVLLS